MDVIERERTWRDPREELHLATPRRWTAAIPLLLVLGCACALRWYRLGANSLWIDEFATLRISSLPLSGIVAENIRNSSFEPPLYFWLMHGIVQLFGSAEAALRFPSALAGALTIPALWLLLRELTDSRRAALLGAALLAFNPLHLWYSQEARPYALVILFVCLATLCLARALRRGNRSAWIGFTGWTLLAVFTHLVGLGLLAVSWLWAGGRAGRRTVVSLMAASAVVLACVGPLLFALARAGAERHGNGSPPRSVTGLELPYTLFSYVAGYSLGPSPREIQNMGAAAALAAHPIESVVVAATVVALLGLIAVKRPRCSAGLALLFMLYVVLVFVASVATGKAYNIRYTLPGLLGFVGLLALALHQSPLRLRQLGVTIALGVFVWADVQWFLTSRYRKDDSRAVVQWLSERLPGGAVVIAAPGYTTGVLAHYAAVRGADLRFVPEEEFDKVQPAALLLTRLHHVTDPESIQERFRQLAGPGVREDSLGGYLVFSTTRATAQLPGR